MSRPANTQKYAPASESYSESDKPTRPLPRFDLAAALAEMDKAAAYDPEATVAIGAEETKRLLAKSVPAPALSLELEALAELPISFPRAVPSLIMPEIMPAPEVEVVAPPISCIRAKVQLAPPIAARPRLDAQNLVVAGIWATAATLIAFLIFMVTSV